MHHQHAYVGTYTGDSESEGLYTLDVTTHDDDVDVQRRPATPLDDDPAFLVTSPTGEFLYVVHEVPDGRVTAFRRREDGSLDRLNDAASGAGGPCHCSVHPSGDYLFVAHYTGAAVSVLPITDDGRVESPSDVVHHEGSSVHPSRQTEAHPHSITPGPNGQYLYVPDLGTDEVVVYELDDNDGALLDRVAAVSTRDGAGPRHIAFHPNDPSAYVINELDSTLTTYEWSATTGTLTAVSTVSTLPAGYEGDNATADVQVHASGRYVYGSNRGHDSVVTFAVDSDDGTLTLVDHTDTGGQWPRHFALDTTGHLLFAENQHTDSVVPFHIDGDAGTLTPVGDSVAVPEPVCMVCLPAGEE